MPRSTRSQSLTGKITPAEERRVVEIAEARGIPKSHFVRWLVLREFRRVDRPKKPDASWVLLRLFAGTMRQTLEGEELERFEAMCDEYGVR